MRYPSTRYKLTQQKSGGIGPTYTSMAARNGITISEMFNEETFERRLRNLATGYKKRFGDLLEYDVEEGTLLLFDAMIPVTSWYWRAY